MRAEVKPQSLVTVAIVELKHTELWLKLQARIKKLSVILSLEKQTEVLVHLVRTCYRFIT